MFIKRILVVVAIVAMASVHVEAAPLAPQGGTITSVGATAGGGLTGGGTGGPVYLGLITTCSSGQVLAWSGTAWACGANGGSVLGTYPVTAYGALCNGSTNDSTAVLAAITAASAAGGGIIQFPSGTCRIDSQILIPNDGAAWPYQKSMRLTGAGPSMNAYGNPPTGGTILDLRYAGSNGKIVTLGRGSLEIDHMSLIETQAATTTPFIYTTNTRLHVHDVYAIGYSGKATTTCDQDFLVFGGTTTALDGTTAAAFQGYGTVIENNGMDRLRRFAYLRTFANAIQITNNSVYIDAGSNLATGAAIELDGMSNTASGNYFAGNLIEMVGYPYAFKLTAAVLNSFDGNNLYDVPPTGAVALAYFRFESTATNNWVRHGFGNDFIPLASDASGGTNTTITMHQSQVSTWSQPQTWSNASDVFANTSNKGPTIQDSTGHQTYQQLHTAGAQLGTFILGDEVAAWWHVSSTDMRLQMLGTTNNQIASPQAPMEIYVQIGSPLFLGDFAQNIYVLGGDILGGAAGSAEIIGSTAATATVPTLLPKKSDLTTGIGAQATGNVSMIVGSTEIARATSTGLSATTLSTGGPGTGAKWSAGAGVPASSCSVGDEYSNTTGGVGTTLYTCTATNTWTAVTSGGPGTGTAGTLPIWSSSTTLGSSGISYSAPSFTYLAGTSGTHTFSNAGGTTLTIDAGGALLPAGYVEIANTQAYYWSTTASPSGAVDLRLRRTATKTVTLDDGVAGAATLAVTGPITGDAGSRVFDVAGTGLSSSANTVSLAINAGTTQTCGAGTFVSALTGAGITTCTTPASGISGLTAGTIPQAASSTTLGNSIISQASGGVVITGNLGSTLVVLAAKNIATSGSAEFDLVSTTAGAANVTGVWQMDSGGNMVFRNQGTGASGTYFDYAAAGAHFRNASSVDQLTLSASGAVVPGTLGVTGAATMSSTLKVTGPLTAGAGTDSPSATGVALYATNAGSTTIDVRDSTNHVEGYIASASTGVVVGSFTNHQLRLQTNGTTALTIDTAQGVSVANNLTATGLVSAGGVTVTSGNKLNFTGNLIDNGTVSTCTSGCTVVSGSMGSTSGTITATAASITVTLGVSYSTNPPTCVWSTNGSTKTATAGSTTSTFTLSGATSTQVYSFICMGGH